MIPGVCENPVILNLHFLFGNLKLSAGCQATEFAVEGRRPIAESPLALLGVKIAGTALWDYKRERTALQKKNHKLQKRITGYDVNASYPVLFLAVKP